MGVAVRLLLLALLWSTLSSGRSCFSRLADRAIRVVGYATARLLLRLRYEVDVEGLAEIEKRGRRGILFLPNHPAAIDPFLVMVNLGEAYSARPVMLAWRAESEWMRPFARAVRVVPIPDMTLEDPENERRMEEALDEIAKGLRLGENFIFWPGGRLQSRHREKLNGTSGVDRILHRVPDARVVLLRARGLYGSLSGRAHTGELKPGRFLAMATAALVANGVFFIPKRPVTFTFWEPGDRLPKGRIARNRFLENFYNEDALSALHVPYFFWQGNHPVLLPDPARARLAGRLEDVPESVRREVTAEVRRIVAERDGGVPEISPRHDLGWDLGLDSLDRLRLNAWLARVYGWKQPTIERLVTIEDLLLTASGQDARRVGP